MKWPIFSNSVLVYPLGLAAVCVSGCEKQTNDAIFSVCDSAPIGEIAPDDDSLLGFSAAQVLAPLSATSWSVAWDPSPDDAVVTPALSALETVFSLSASTVEAVQRADLSDGGCEGVEGDALILPVSLDVSAPDGSLVAHGEIELVAGAADDPTRLLLTRGGPDLALSAVPDDVSAAAKARAEERDVTDYELSLSLWGTLDAPEIIIGLDSEHYLAVLASDTLTPE